MRGIAALRLLDGCSLELLPTNGVFSNLIRGDQKKQNHAATIFTNRGLRYDAPAWADNSPRWHLLNCHPSGFFRRFLMRRLVLFSLALFTALCFVVATDRNAWGYVDPGTGLLALQGIASALATCGFFFRRKIKTLFPRKEADKGTLPRVADKENSANAV
jgi:hypothetical protein